MTPSTLNLCAHAIPDLEDLVIEAQAKKLPSAVLILKLLIKGLRDATKFILPLNGKIFDSRVSSRSELELYQLPFPVVAAEYLMDKKRREQKTENSDLKFYPHSKRIALAFDVNVDEWHEALKIPLGANRNEQEEEMVLIWSISYADEIKHWGPSWCGLIEFNAAPPLEASAKEMKRIKKLIDPQYRELLSPAKIVPRSQFIPLGEIGYHMKNHLLSRNMNPQQSAIFDNSTEVLAVRQLCAALNCSNVETETIAAPKRLNKKRIKNKKLPFFEYKVLTVGNSKATSKGAYQGGTHNSPREHIRRGHPRRYSKGKTIWIQPHMVGDNTKGKIIKKYRVPNEKNQR